MMGAQRVWTDDMDAALRRLVDERQSAGRIATVLSAQMKITITRNSVIGRVARLKLKLNGQVKRAGQHGGWGETKRKPAAKTKRVARAKAPVQPRLEPPPEPEPLPPYEPGEHDVLLKDHSGPRCRWPLWSDRALPPADELFYCGAPTSGGSWCATHGAIVRSGRRLAPISETSSRPRRGVLAETFS